MYQCIRCGSATTSALKQSEFSPDVLASLEPWDDALQKRYWDDLREKERIAREGESAEELAAKREKYHEYLKSPAWLHKREQVLERDAYICQGCRDARATQVHHLTYAHIFNELLFELTSLCGECHDRCHTQP